MEDNGASETSPHPGGLASDQPPKSSAQNKPSYQTGRTGASSVGKEEGRADMEWTGTGEETGEEEAALLPGAPGRPWGRASHMDPEATSSYSTFPALSGLGTRWQLH